MAPGAKNGPLSRMNRHNRTGIQTLPILTSTIELADSSHIQFGLVGCKKGIAANAFDLVQVELEPLEVLEQVERLVRVGCKKGIAANAFDLVQVELELVDLSNFPNLLTIILRCTKYNKIKNLF